MKALFTPLKWGSAKTEDNETFEADEGSSPSSEDGHLHGDEDNIFSYPAPPIPRPFATSDDQQEDESTEPGPASSPNQILADFFQKKGSEPLSDIEAAGVMSILNRQASSADESSEPSLYSIHTPSLKRFQQYPSTANMFTPKGMNKRLKRSRDQAVSTPQRNSPQPSSPSSSPKYSPLFGSNKKKRPSQSPSFTPRKMSHFSSIPSPYRPTSSSNVYQALTNPEKSQEAEVVVLDGPEEEAIEVASPEKTLSQTASTLLSLIDDPPETSVLASPGEKETPKPFVNPYASTASRSTPRTNNQAKLVRKPSSPPSNIVQTLERTKPTNGTASSSPISEPNSAQKRTIPAYLDKYKPMRSSTLRQSLVPSPSNSPDGSSYSEALPGSSLSTPIRSDAKRSESASTTIIEHSKLTLTWSVPDFLDDEEEVASDVSEPAASKPLYPQLPAVPAATTPFKFGSTTDKPSVSKPFTFVSPSSAPVSSDTQIDVTKTPKLEHKSLPLFSQPNNLGASQGEKPISSLFGTSTQASFGDPKPLYPVLDDKKPVAAPSLFGATTSAPLFGAKPLSNGSASLANATKSEPTIKIAEFSTSFVFPTAEIVAPPTVISEQRLQAFKNTFEF